MIKKMNPTVPDYGEKKRKTIKKCKLSFLLAGLDVGNGKI